MVSLYKIDGEQWFKCQWPDPVTGRKKTRTLKGIKSRRDAETIRANIADKINKQRQGLIDPTEDRYAREGRRPIEEQIAAWQKTLASAGNTPTYPVEESNLVRRVMEAAKVDKLSDIVPGDIKNAIANMKRERGEGTLSNRAKNKALTACKMFCEQCRRDHKLRTNPLKDVRGWNADIDPRRQHVAYDDADLLAIIEAARASKDTVEGLTGTERAILYETAAGTGFRRRTLLALTPAHLHLDDLEIHILPSNVKNKRPKIQPITEELAAKLAAHVAGMKPNQKLWRPHVRANTGEMIRHDAEAAGLAHAVDDSHFRTFHSLRATAITKWGQAAGLKVAQDLAGHSTPALTSRYMRPTMSDYRKAIKAVPQAKEGKKRKQA